MRSRHGWILTGLVAVLFAAACASAPKEALGDAEKALLEAETKSECAEEKFLAAQNLLAEAKRLVEQEKYDEAERKAKAAEKLAKEARAEAEANWEECQKRKRIAQQARGEATDEGEESEEQEEAIPELQTVFFDYDSADISPGMREILDGNAAWMRHNGGVTVVVEGHTDERGSVEYNLALGERRAKSVRDYLVQLGIDDERLYVLSYGEEKPRAYGQTSADFQKNRRVEFVPKR